MAVKISWRSQKGRRTEDNRDHAGVGLRSGAMLCVVTDGSTSGPESGELAREIVRNLVDWYVAADDCVTADTLAAQLRRAHSNLSGAFPRGAASYLILHFGETEPAITLHAGDCLLGRSNGSGPIHWLTMPHTLANAAGEVPISAIASSHARHLLTRSFRGNEYTLPDVTEVTTGEGGAILAATDGFWADLDTVEQESFMHGHDLPVPDGADDRSILQIRFLGDEQAEQFRLVDDMSPNFYIKKT